MKIYAIRYAEHFKYATKGSVFRNTPDAAERIEDFAFFYYLAEVDDKYYLVDTGFRDEELAEKMGVHIFPMGEVEQVFGKMPQIDTVIITHSHWDHNFGSHDTELIQRYRNEIVRQELRDRSSGNRIEIRDSLAIWT